MRNNWRWETNITVTVRSNGLVVAQKHIHNLITNVGLGLARDAILGDESLQIARVGIGAGADSPTLTDTTLQDERERVEIIDRDASGLATAITVAYVQPSAGTGYTINEIGWFGGSLASATVDTGVLISRILYNHTKTTLESIQIDRQDTFAEGA